jgi:hypothetical protein
VILLLVAGLRKPWSRRSQVLEIGSKELDGDTQIAKQQSFIDMNESMTVHAPGKKGSGL